MFCRFWSGIFLPFFPTRESHVSEAIPKPHNDPNTPHTRMFLGTLFPLAFVCSSFPASLRHTACPDALPTMPTLPSPAGSSAIHFPSPPPSPPPPSSSFPPPLLLTPSTPTPRSLLRPLRIKPSNPQPPNQIKLDLAKSRPAKWPLPIGGAFHHSPCGMRASRATKDSPLTPTRGALLVVLC